MPAMVCESCGAKTTALHTGGDARIPEPGVCSICEPVLAAAARAKLDTKRGAALKSYAADIGIEVA